MEKSAATVSQSNVTGAKEAKFTMPAVHQSDDVLGSALVDVLTAQGARHCSMPVAFTPEPSGVERGHAVPVPDTVQAGPSNRSSRSVWSRRPGTGEHSAQQDVALLDVSAVELWTTRRSLSRSGRMPSSSPHNSPTSHDLWVVAASSAAALRERIAAVEEENERLWGYVRELREANVSLCNVHELQTQAYDHEVARLRRRMAELSAKAREAPAIAPPTGAFTPALPRAANRAVKVIQVAHHDHIKKLGPG